jgi:hypothetical protein
VHAPHAQDEEDGPDPKKPRLGEAEEEDADGHQQENAADERDAAAQEEDEEDADVVVPGAAQQQQQQEQQQQQQEPSWVWGPDAVPEGTLRQLLHHWVVGPIT